MSTTLLALKLVASLATLVFGIAGLGIRTREESGALTRGGRVVLAGLILGSVITIAIQFVEHQIQTEARIAEERRIGEQLLEQQRLLLVSTSSFLSTKDAVLNLIFFVPAEILNNDRYFARVQKAGKNTKRCQKLRDPIGEALDEYPAFRCRDYEVHYVRFEKLPRIIFQPSSSLVPQAAEKDSGLALREIKLELTFDFMGKNKYISPIPIDFAAIRDGTQYEADQDKGVYVVVEAPIPEKLFREAHFNSLVDVAGGYVDAKLVVDALCERAPCTHIDRVKQRLSLQSLTIRFPHGRDLIFPMSLMVSDAEPIKGRLSGTHYRIHIPENLVELSSAGTK